MKDNIKKISLGLASIVFWIILWFIAATIANNNLLFKIPTPIDTAKEFLNIVGTNVFWYAVNSSLWHIISGFSIGVISGLFCGLISGSSNLFKVFSSPVSRLIRSMPVAAIIILAWLWIPSDIIPSFIAFLMVFPIVWSQVETGLLSVDNRIIEMARIMDMKKSLKFLSIKYPINTTFDEVYIK